jgi:X-Pro dipeptidyl-peptidase
VGTVARPLTRVVLSAAALSLAVPLLAAPAHAAPPSPGRGLGGVPRPAFQDGQAQPVFDPAQVIVEDVWVRAPVDSDGDGRDDEVHVVVKRHQVTEQGLDSPVVYEVSPYFAGGNDITNHNVDVPLWYPTRPGHPRGAGAAASTAALAETAGPSHPIGSASYEAYFLSRGFAMVFAESLGSGHSTGCPTSGGRNETIGAKAVVDWLNGRASARTASGAPVVAHWTNGQVGMMGVSYNGTLPNAVATTGVEGLDAIVPIAAISSWYDYYRADGAVVAPGTFQGEDTDVLAEYVLTRDGAEVCRPVVESLTREQDRLSGDYSRFWAERDYLRDVDRVHAATLAVHGLNDWNVKTKHVAQWYAALRENDVPHKIWLHQFGHRGPLGLRRDEWLRTLNRWFTRYLWDVPNGVEREPRATIQREDLRWTEEADWPHAAADEAALYPTAGGPTSGGLSTRPVHGRPVVESLTDNARILAEDLAAAPSSPHRLVYDTAALSAPVRFSGTVVVRERLAFNHPAANVTALLVDRAPDGKVHVITRGWTDPQNRHRIDHTQPIRAGQWYTVDIEMQPDDYVVPAGHRIGLVLLSSDFDYTLRPPPGIRTSVDLKHTSLVLPVVGGSRALAAALRS